MTLTLREGTGDILSRGPNFSISCIHRVKQQPVLIAPLQNQWLTTQDGDAVPLWNIKTHYCTSEENPVVVIQTKTDTHRVTLYRASLRLCKVVPSVRSVTELNQSSRMM